MTNLEQLAITSEDKKSFISLCNKEIEKIESLKHISDVLSVVKDLERDFSNLILNKEDKSLILRITMTDSFDDRLLFKFSFAKKNGKGYVDIVSNSVSTLTVKPEHIEFLNPIVRNFSVNYVDFNELGLKEFILEKFLSSNLKSYFDMLILDSSLDKNSQNNKSFKIKV